MRELARYCCVSLLLVLGSCQWQEAQDVQETRFLLGTIVEFTVYSEDEHLALAAIAKAAQVMQTVENQFTTFGDTDHNTVQHFNRAKVGQKVLLDPEVEQILIQALLIHAQTKGAFDPTLGQLNQQWGFSSKQQPHKPLGSNTIKESLASSGVAHIQADDQHLWWKKVDGLKLDFGAIAKGYAIDKGIESFRNSGVKHVIINAGGDMRILGDHGGKPWRIGVRHPRLNTTLGWFAVSRDVSIVTSGDYERFFMYQGKRYHHIIDPSTGLPATKSMSTTVSAPTAAMADALSTAMFILGHESGMPIIERMQHVEAVWVDEFQSVHMSSGMETWLNKGD